MRKGVVVSWGEGIEGLRGHCWGAASELQVRIAVITIPKTIITYP
jgi:hypothetical protein